MKLDRNVNGDGRGKYAVINLRKLEQLRSNGMLKCKLSRQFNEVPEGSIQTALAWMEEKGVLSYGTEPGDEFFVIKLKDLFAPPALSAYSMAAFGEAIARGPGPVGRGLMEYAEDVKALAEKADHMKGKIPD